MKETNRRRSRLSKKEKATTLLSLALATAVVLTLYRVAMSFAWFTILFWIYLGIATVLILAYVIYNRGFSRKGVTADMLPREWSEEQKADYLADGEKRMKRSRWMLIPILALLITFAVDVIELFAIPFFTGLFGGGA